MIYLLFIFHLFIHLEKELRKFDNCSLYVMISRAEKLNSVDMLMW